MQTFQDEVGLSDKKTVKPPAPPTLAKKAQRLVKRFQKPLILVAAIIALLAILYYAHDAFTHETTDNAYVTGHLHQIATRINGVVIDVPVHDNQKVLKGDVLVKLDPMEYVALETAAEAQLAKAQADLKRQTQVDAHATSERELDATKSTFAVDLAQLKLAQLQIEYSTIRAPSDGIIGRKSVEVGNRVSSGQSLMVVVEPELWVVANFKETQLASMHAGQPVTIGIDAIPGKIFEGHVESFSPATGNQFALLPADNSTGNFTKIVQRVPVKIVFNPETTKGYEDRIRAGESAVVKVALVP